MDGDKMFTLESKTLYVLAIKNGSNAKIFKNLRCGDTIKLELELDKLESTNGKAHSPLIKITNTQTGDFDFKYINQVVKSLSCFEWFEWRETSDENV